MQPSPPKAGDRFMRRPEVINRSGLSTTSIYAGMKNGTFPVCLKLSPRLSVWTESSIDRWVAERIQNAPRKG